VPEREKEEVLVAALPVASGAKIARFHHASEGNAVVVKSWNLRVFRSEGVDVDV
jgi:hypothetical protein